MIENRFIKNTSVLPVSFDFVDYETTCLRGKTDKIAPIVKNMLLI